MFKTTIALTNNIVGSTILILPILFLSNGILLSILLVFINGFYNYYSCKITIQHLGNNQNYYSDAIDRHYKKEVFPLYEICCFLSNQLFFYVYFNLMMKQINGLFQNQIYLLPWLPYIAYVILIVIVIKLKGHSSGVTLMALGIISTLIYCLFLIWAFLNRPFPQVNTFSLIKGEKFLTLTNVLGTAFTTQTFVIQIIQVNSEGNNLKTVVNAFILSGIIYIFVGMAGGYSIIDLIPINTNPETINQYFSSDKWQIVVLQIIYIVHIYSVWPQWTYINCDRILKMLKTQVTRTKQLIYITLSPLIACILYVMNVDIFTFIDLNAGICQFILAYIIPIQIHTRCRYLFQTSPLSNQQIGIQNIPYVQTQFPNNNYLQKQLQKEYQEQNERKCITQRAKVTCASKVIDIIIISTMLIFGGCIMLQTIWEVFFKNIFK